MKETRTTIITLFKLLFSFSIGVFCLNGSALSADDVEYHYRNQVSFINQSLISKQQVFEASPLELAQFVDKSVLPLWNSTKTLKGLFGKSNWQNLSQKDRDSLQKGFNDTIQRYVQEGFALYDGQELEFVGVKFNKKETRGILTLEIKPNIMPSFNVDFKIFNDGKSWQLYDILIKGVSYITLKKDSFRQSLKNQGIDAVLAAIHEKNKGFISSGGKEENATTDLTGLQTINARPN